MQKRGISTLLVMAFTMMSFLSFAGHSTESQAVTTENTDDTEARKEAVKEVKDHHLMDDYNFTIVHSDDLNISFPLPVILWQDGLHVFMSSALSHDAIKESNGSYFKLHHGKIYSVNADGSFTSVDEHHHPTSKVLLDFSITKNVVVIILMSVFIFFLFKKIAKSYGNGDMPKKAGRFLEPIVVFVRDDIAIPNIGEKQHKRFMSYLLTIFFFIWFLNLAGMTPLGVGVTNNIAVTFSLAMFTFFITQFSGNKSYWGHIFWMPGVPKPMRIILAPIELLGLFIKPFALMIRLYANMTAGHVVIMSIIGLIFVMQNYFATGAFLSLTLFLSILELLVAALQAYIFTMLTALFIGSAVQEHH